MNYYPFHLGDYASHTAHLEPMEDLAYRRMLDLCYRTEAPLPTDWREIARLIRLRDQGPAIETVLSEFFQLTDDGWINKRAAAEIQKMQDKQAKAKAAGSLGGKTKAANAEQLPSERLADAKQTPSERLATNTNTNTNTKDKVKSIVAALLSDVDEQIAKDWQALRKSKKAAITATAIDGIRAEALKAGLSLQDALAMCCQRGWTGFKAEWAAGQRAPPRPEWDGKSAKQREAETFVRELTGNGSATESGRTVTERVDRAPVLAISDGLRHRKNE